LRDIVAALVGSLIVLMMLWTWRRMKGDGTSAPIARS
jgi:hypothetical protein